MGTFTDEVCRLANEISDFLVRTLGIVLGSILFVIFSMALSFYTVFAGLSIIGFLAFEVEESGLIIPVIPTSSPNQAVYDPITDFADSSKNEKKKDLSPKAKRRKMAKAFVAKHKKHLARPNNKYSKKSTRLAKQHQQTMKLKEQEVTDLKEHVDNLVSELKRSENHRAQLLQLLSAPTDRYDKNLKIPGRIPTMSVRLPMPDFRISDVINRRKAQSTTPFNITLYKMPETVVQFKATVSVAKSSPAATRTTTDQLVDQPVANPVAEPHLVLSQTKPAPPAPPAQSLHSTRAQLKAPSPLPETKPSLAPGFPPTAQDPASHCRIFHEPTNPSVCALSSIQSSLQSSAQSSTPPRMKSLVLMLARLRVLSTVNISISSSPVRPPRTPASSKSLVPPPTQPVETFTLKSTPRIIKHAEKAVTGIPVPHPFEPTSVSLPESPPQSPPQVLSTTPSLIRPSYTTATKQTASNNTVPAQPGFQPPYPGVDNSLVVMDDQMDVDESEHKSKEEDDEKDNMELDDQKDEIELDDQKDKMELDDPELIQSGVVALPQVNIYSGFSDTPPRSQQRQLEKDVDMADALPKTQVPMEHDVEMEDEPTSSSAPVTRANGKGDIVDMDVDTNNKQDRPSQMTQPTAFQQPVTSLPTNYNSQPRAPHPQTTNAVMVENKPDMRAPPASEPENKKPVFIVRRKPVDPMVQPRRKPRQPRLQKPPQQPMTTMPQAGTLSTVTITAPPNPINGSASEGTIHLFRMSRDRDSLTPLTPSFTTHKRLIPDRPARKHKYDEVVAIDEDYDGDVDLSMPFDCDGPPRRILPLPTRAVQAISAVDDEASRQRALETKRRWLLVQEQEAAAGPDPAMEQHRSRPPPKVASKGVSARDDRVMLFGTPELRRELLHRLQALWPLLPKAEVDRIRLNNLRSKALAAWRELLKPTNKDRLPDNTYIPMDVFEREVSKWMQRVIDLMSELNVVSQAGTLLQTWGECVARQGHLPEPQDDAKI
ncbi:uncharacterized protein ColSpa_01940 [Colletotrichum spaethianum]|uniref:Uncharacterized protein n=1 Tax=Colletotrichum spaethianum TaxID=700344 RepID=A0AA37L851_9PEZI|nr:uncharacterized protein ColSpa_01940 [Colletotrichum spaethianum]GKT41759.1 hypothetical protein ColSpa_01940 [Colletotrichum spaethianum]